MWNRGNVMSPTIQIAMECGFIDKDEAIEVWNELSKNSNGQDPVLDLLVEKGVLTEEEAQVVSKMRREKDPGSHLLELTKSKRKAIKMVSDSEARLRTVLAQEPS